MNSEDRDILIEHVASAWRPRDVDGGILWHPAWFDLDESARREAYEQTVRQRMIEAALHPRGYSGTCRAVMQRIEAMGATP